MNEYKVTITETLKKTVTVEAENREAAEQLVNDAWRRAEYILDAEDFEGVEFEAEETERESVEKNKPQKDLER